jgi:hypothetical protein
MTSFLFASLAIATPAHATGGLLCQTAGPKQIEVTLGFGHAPSASLFSARLLDDGKPIPVTASKWWMQKSELRLALVSENALRNELLMIAEWSDATDSYDGTITRNGRKRWVRCREA